MDVSDVIQKGEIQKADVLPKDTFYGMSWDAFDKLVDKKGFKKGLRYQVNDEDMGSKRGEVTIYYNTNNGLIIWADSNVSDTGHERIMSRLCGVIDYSQLNKESQESKDRLFETLNNCWNDSAENGRFAFSYYITEGLINRINQLESNAKLLPIWGEVKPLLYLGGCPIREDKEEIVNSYIEELPPDAQKIINSSLVKGIKIKDLYKRSSSPFYDFIGLIKNLGFKEGFRDIKYDTSRGIIDDRSESGEYRTYFNTENGLIICIESHQATGGICSGTLYGMIENSEMDKKNLLEALEGYPDESKQIKLGEKEIGFSLQVDSFLNDGLLTEGLINTINQLKETSLLPMWKGGNKPDIDSQKRRGLKMSELPQEAHRIINLSQEEGKPILPSENLSSKESNLNLSSKERKGFIKEMMENFKTVFRG